MIINRKVLVVFNGDVNGNVGDEIFEFLENEWEVYDLFYFICNFFLLEEGEDVISCGFVLFL